MSKEKDKRITRELLVQTSNSVTKSKTSEGHVIRNWKIHIEQLPKTNSRGEVVNLSMNYVESVTYKLHESFANSVRVIKEAPFELRERGWGEFDMLITLNFVNNLYPPQSFGHFLSFAQPSSSEKKELEFINPKPDFKRLLGQLLQSPASGRNNSDIDAVERGRNTSSKTVSANVKRSKPQPPPLKKQRSPSPVPKAAYVEEPNIKQRIKKRPASIPDSDTSDDDIQNLKFSRRALSELIPQLRGNHVIDAIDIIKKGIEVMPAPAKNHLQLDLYDLSKPSLLELWDHCQTSLKFYKELDQLEREQNIEMGSKKAWDLYVTKMRKKLVEEASDSSASEDDSQVNKRYKSSREDRRINQSPVSDAKSKKNQTNAGSDERESFDRSGKSLPPKNEKNNSDNARRSRSKERSISRSRRQTSPIHATESQGSYSKRSSVNHSPVRSSAVERTRDSGGTSHSRNHSPERRHGSTRNSSRNRSPEKEYRRDRDAERSRAKERSGTTTRDRSRDRDRSKDRYERYSRPDSARERDREKGRGERERERDRDNGRERERSSTYSSTKDSDRSKDKRGSYKPSDYYDGAAGRRNTEYRSSASSSNQRYR